MTFSESVTGFDAGDVSLSNGTLSTFVGSGASYSFDVTPTADGVVTLSVPANSSLDAAGNTATVSNTLTLTSDRTARQQRSRLQIRHWRSAKRRS